MIFSVSEFESKDLAASMSSSAPQSIFDDMFKFLGRGSDKLPFRMPYNYLEKNKMMD